MNALLQSLHDAISQQSGMDSAERDALLRIITDADRQWAISEFKLERTDKVKRTTTVLLEQTIAELEQKRKDVEAQNRELALEAALERVRTVAMSMQKPDDMLDVCRVIAHELEAMGIRNIRDIQTATLNEETGLYLNYEYFTRYKNTIVLVLDFRTHPVVKSFAETMLREKDSFFTTSFEGEALTEWQAFRKSTNQMPDPYLDEVGSVHYYFYSIGSGALGISSYGPLQEHEVVLFRRFRNVFDLAYRRFLDIEQAMAQAREAQIQSGLERVRSRTLAMQTCEELAETAAVFFRELISLGIAPSRLYIAIIDSDDPNELWFYITNEDGGQDCSMYTADVRSHPVLQLKYNGWATKERSLHLVLEGDALSSYLLYLRDQLHMPINADPTVTRRVHDIAYFSQGFVGIASRDEQPEETAQLLMRFADVFNLTYTRFSDLKVAEGLAEQAEKDLIQLKEEKLRTENALAELKAAQAQLIHAEKMASLGEMTAGIAHEIQNPLNFINNFAEVNAELIDELNQELATGNMESANEIGRNIRENEAKIVFHGKRADGIVKSMLQHSRVRTGNKEAVDINALVDEYLRLAYHGFRARDKSFNAKFEFQPDPLLPKIQAVYQDIGRVVLNIISNAFHAVTERASKAPAGYSPEVMVSTSQQDGHIAIVIRDNGTGMPPEVLDKIFQPFFTTKPTGQGTGLGLSISYDIIRAHGGEIKVDSKEGKGTTFVIGLPLA